MSELLVVFFLMIRRPPRSTLFPFTTLLPIYVGAAGGQRPGRGPHPGGAGRVRGAVHRPQDLDQPGAPLALDRNRTRLNSSPANSPFPRSCLKKKSKTQPASTPCFTFSSRLRD